MDYCFFNEVFSSIDCISINTAEFIESVKNTNKINLNLLQKYSKSIYFQSEIIYDLVFLCDNIDKKILEIFDVPFKFDVERLIDDVSKRWNMFNIFDYYLGKDCQLNNLTKINNTFSEFDIWVLFRIIRKNKKDKENFIDVSKISEKKLFRWKSDDVKFIELTVCGYLDEFLGYLRKNIKLNNYHLDSGNKENILNLREIENSFCDMYLNYRQDLTDGDDNKKVVRNKYYDMLMEKLKELIGLI